MYGIIEIKNSRRTQVKLPFTEMGKIFGEADFREKSKSWILN